MSRMASSARRLRSDRRRHAVNRRGRDRSGGNGAGRAFDAGRNDAGEERERQRLEAAAGGRRRRQRDRQRRRRSAGAAGSACAAGRMGMRMGMGMRVRLRLRMGTAVIRRMQVRDGHRLAPLHAGMMMTGRRNSRRRFVVRPSAGHADRRGNALQGQRGEQHPEQQGLEQAKHRASIAAARPPDFSHAPPAAFRVQAGGRGPVARAPPFATSSAAPAWPCPGTSRTARRPAGPSRSWSRNARRRTRCRIRGRCRNP